MNIFQSWSHRWFGWWREEGVSTPIDTFPSVYEFQDRDWLYPKKNLLVQYLSESPILFRLGSVKYAFGGYVSRTVRTDGFWVWCDDIVPYVLNHQIRVPNNLLIHLEDRNFLRKIRLDVTVEDVEFGLQWPMKPNFLLSAWRNQGIQNLTLFSDAD